LPRFTALRADYEIRLKDGSVKKYNLHLQKDQQTGRWFWEGGI
jgi:hypothetical protein